MKNDDRMVAMLRKNIELMELVSSIKNGEDADFIRIKHLIRDIYNDELNLILAIKNYESERESKMCQIDIPSFMKKRGA